jgi:EmrB/QacA subfamily drug resistance transporter
MTAPVSDRTRWLALYVLCTGVLMIVLDVTIVNVAIPSIKDDLNFRSDSDATWVVNAYLIPFGGLLLLAGRLGDLIGQRRIFMVGLTVFTVASAVCAAAQNQATLIIARFVQGAGGALTSAVVLAMIVTMFPEPKEQAKAMGVYGFVASAGGSIGLLAGGALTSAINWHWIFLINLPIGVATGAMALKYVSVCPGFGKGRADVLGAVVLTGGLMLGIYAIVEVQKYGWASLHTIGLSAIAVALVAGFIARQAKIAEPLMPLRLFRSRNVSGANVIQPLLLAAMFAMFFLGALYLQGILGYDAIGVGLAFLPTTIVMGGMSLYFAQPLAMRFGPRNVLIASLVVIAVGLLLFVRVPTHANYWTDLLPPFLLVGLGVGACFPALMGLAMSGATPSDAGLASGLVNTTAQLGGAIGLAVMSTFAASRTAHLKASGHSEAAALNSGYHLAYGIGTALLVLAVVIALGVLRQGPAMVHEAAPDGAVADSVTDGDALAEPAT